MDHPCMNRREAVALLLALGAAGARAEPELAELSDLARVRASGVLKVAVYKDNPPFSDAPAGDAMKGLDVSLAEALAQQLKLQLALLPFDAGENMNDDLRNMVWRGHYLGYGPADVMLNVPVDKHLIRQTRQALIFAPYMRQVPVLLHDTRELPAVAAAGDLKGHRLAAERGTGTASVLMGHGGALLREQVTLYRSGIEAAQAVAEGRAAAAYVLRSQAEAAMARSSAPAGQLALTSLALGQLAPEGWPIGMAVKASHRELGQALDAALQAIRSSGEMLAIFRRQGMTLTAP